MLFDSIELMWLNSGSDPELLPEVPPGWGAVPNAKPGNERVFQAWGLES